MHKMHGRHLLKVGSKNSMTYNIKTVFIAFRKKYKDNVKLYAFNL